MVKPIKKQKIGTRYVVQKDIVSKYNRTLKMFDILKLTAISDTGEMTLLVKPINKEQRRFTIKMYHSTLDALFYREEIYYFKGEASRP